MRYLLLSLLAVSGCAGSSNPCANVVCGEGRACDALSGRCLRVDGGDVADSGVDAGMDAGTDAGCACKCPDSVCALNNSCIPVAYDGGARAAPAPSETCSAAVPFTITGCDQRTYRFRATLNGTDDEQGLCSAAGSQGRDLVYVLQLEAESDLRVDVVPVSGSTAEPVVYVRNMPCNGQELACVRSGGPFASSVFLRSRPAGPYAIFVDTWNATTGGEVEVTLTLSSPTKPGNETCLTADPITTDGGVVRVDLSTAANDEGLMCNTAGVGSRDVAYRFRLESRSDVLVRASRVDPGVSPFVELRRDGCLAGSTQGCSTPNAVGQTQLLVRGASAGDYFVIVESFDGGAAGNVDVSVTVPAPPPLPEDTCDGRDIVFADGGFFTELDVDTSTATDDEEGTCNLKGGAEYVYHLHLLDPQHVTITASRAPGSFADPVLYIRGGACTGPELTGGCSDDPNDGAATETVSTGTGTLPPGHYYIFIESYDQSVGPIHVTVYAGP